MDNELRKLERDYEANPTLEVAERLLQCRARVGAFTSLMEVPEADFLNWRVLYEQNLEESFTYMPVGSLGILPVRQAPKPIARFLQLPNGILIRYGNEGANFIPGIRIKSREVK